MNEKCSLREVLIMVGIALFTLFLVQVGNAIQTVGNQEKEIADMKRRQIVATRIETPPKIDGILDDPIWKKAQPSEGFIQTKPDKGKPMTQRTVIRILYDDENIYLGFQCYDAEPEKVIGTEMRRDYEVWFVNDYIRFILDTYHDLRTSYYFGTNPLGAQVDARVTDNGNYHQSWDAVWKCAATPHSEGWSAEFSIPFRQLRFPTKEKHVWGFNCARTIRRSNEEGCWSSTQGLTVTSISNAGELVGLENISQGHRLEIRPAVVGGAEVNYHSETNVDSVRKPSLDIKYGLTSGLTLDATVNTDFAQIEADEERVNLSQFDMFFAEKRPFFLEGVGIFGNPDPFFSNTLPLFYSRCIGSEEDKEVPILGGLKLTGKVGKQSIGLLNVQTDEVDEISSTNFSAFRLQRDILHSSSAGIMFLNKAPWEDAGNQTLGADLRFNPKEGMSIFGSLAKTWTDGLHDKDLAGKISGYWETESSEIGASCSDIQENFNPEMGFVSRKDIRNGDLWGHKSFKIRRSIFRSVGGGGHYGVGLDHDRHLKDRHLGMRAGLELETGDFAEMWYDRNWERLDEGWEIREGILIPAGMHRNSEYGVFVGTNESRRLSIGSSFEGGGFYNGDRNSLSLHGQIRPVPRLLITGNYDRNLINLPDGSFTTNTINSRIIYTFSPDFFVKMFLQWNDEEELSRGNFLLRYTYQPGSDFYIVYNELWRAGKVEQRSIVAKIVYFFNL
ncbi:carbohydrate binding family 9 domain-containing protein [Candidatus Poribacteria bacterium]|nr:carbohydrate binding family 9 domain-containing protein [Candidatus Poribacteria bacterium]